MRIKQHKCRTGDAGEGTRPERQRKAVNVGNCREQGERYGFDAEIPASDVATSHLKNSFARSSRDMNKFIYKIRRVLTGIGFSVKVPVI